MGLGLGPLEVGLIFLVVLLLFGAKRLPELAQGMGRGIRDFKRALNGLDDSAMQQANSQQNYLQGAPVPAGQVPAAQPVAAQPVAAQPAAPPIQE